MQVMTIPDAVKITGMTRYKIVKMMESGAWDIGEIRKNPETGYTNYIIWSHKLAEVMGVPEKKIIAELAKIDETKRNRVYT